MALKKPKQEARFGPTKSGELLILQDLSKEAAQKFEKALKAIISRVRYTGSAYHRAVGSRAGPIARRAGLTSKCPPNWTNATATEALRRAISEAKVSCYWEGAGFPRYVWYLDGDVLYEARLTNRENGEYHAYPLEDRSQWPKNFR
ncbi:hypothetical protein ACVI1L_004711 [Bradyrhizobium sp. USDA 4516]